jgi:acyl-coenzyme A synthetase/AMP-(fatty) acid ligase
VTVSGGSLAPAAFDALAAGLGAHVDIHKTYGQSETFRSAMFLGAQRPEHRARLGSVGRAPPNVTVRVARDRDALAAPGKEGEVIHAGCGTMLGYLGDEALTRSKLARHAAVPDPVIYTGDRGVLDGAGYLTLRGRSDAMIKSNGFRLYPQEIEDVLAEHPQVVEAAVFGIPDANTGERVVAVVVAQPGTAAPELRTFVARRLPDYMVPRHIALWPRLPRTASGKPALAEIRERFAAELG